MSSWRLSEANGARPFVVNGSHEITRTTHEKPLFVPSGAQCSLTLRNREVGPGVTASKFPIRLGVEMDFVSLVAQTVRVDEGRSVHRAGKIPMHLVHLDF